MWHKLQPTICKNCKKTFQPKYYGKIYCCNKCYRSDHIILKKCGNCGSPLRVWKGRADKIYKNIYCSMKCYLDVLGNKDASNIVFFKTKLFPSYEISKCGLVRNIKTKHIKKAGISRKGYYQLRAAHKIYGWHTYKVHRMVALNFIPNLFNLPQVNHKDGNKLNNNVTNLEWVSPGDNQRHSYKLGLSKGSKKRTKEMELQIDTLLNEGKSQRGIGRELKISFGIVNYYLKGRTQA